MGTYRDRHKEIIALLKTMADRTRCDGLPHMTSTRALAAILDLADELDWRQEVSYNLPPFWRMIPDPPAIAKAREEELQHAAWLAEQYGQPDLAEAIRRRDHWPPAALAAA